ncbi:hypothetical protein K6119_04275 [Paracrocinitomix mangrovi]|uniref:hypothetical protein n=1 Tax=Paracrocinitomix mangrovi TaxID=2862509 RepID=UPI001C8DCD96|nr:hypothetical protein [Paracrocinitomix mangrovi]UKN02730.1 hypothetical protein K6119_04275 [Paracrocinitomix mangrovi]
MIIILPLLLIFSCRRNREELEHLKTDEIVDGIFIELYVDNSGGAFASSTYYYYLTDSNNFRKFMSIRDDDNGVYINTASNGVFLNIYYSRMRGNLKDSTFYDVEKLKKENEFDD